mgnify:CR=1 FL=1
MKQYVIIITLISTLLGGSSCKEWLKVDSEDRIMEEESKNPIVAPCMKKEL